MIRTILAALLAALMSLPVCAQTTGLRPDQMVPGTPDISMGLQNNKFVIGTTIPWRTDATAAPVFTIQDNAKIVELTFNGQITAALPDATLTGDFKDGVGFTIQLGPGTLHLASAVSTINGQSSITVGPYQSVGLAARSGHWYGVLSAGMSSGGGGPSPGTCAQSTNFFTAMFNAGIGVDATHQYAYNTLICGLQQDGVFPLLDRLYVFATNTTTGSAQTLALIDLVSGTLAVAHGNPVFNPNAGFTGNEATSPYIDTVFNPTAPGVHFKQNDAHLSVWPNTNISSTGAAIGLQSASADFISSINPWYPTGNLRYANVNNPSGANQTYAGGVVESRGSLLGVRTGANTDDIFYHGVSLGAAITSHNHPSAPLLNGNFYILANNAGGTAAGGAWQIMFATIGGALTPAQIATMPTVMWDAGATGLVPRMCFYLVSVAGPSACQ